jgi:hypothetical protein
MKSTVLLLPIVFLLACTNNKQQLLADATATFKDIKNYAAFKDSVSLNKKQLVSKPYTELSDYFFHLINDDIYTYWKGTPWDFYGTTQTPKTGNIACGYFITTTLNDLGFKIQRRELAECRSGDMIKKLCTDIHTFTEFKNLDSFLKNQPENSVFIIGLDFHTGYIVKDSANIYFLHSNYINKQSVVKEKIKESKALVSNKFYMIGSLTANKKLLEKWVTE